MKSFVHADKFFWCAILAFCVIVISCKQVGEGKFIRLVVREKGFNGLFACRDSVLSHFYFDEFPGQIVNASSEPRNIIDVYFRPAYAPWDDSLVAKTYLRWNSAQFLKIDSAILDCGSGCGFHIYARRSAIGGSDSVIRISRIYWGQHPNAQLGCPED